MNNNNMNNNNDNNNNDNTHHHFQHEPMVSLLESHSFRPSLIRHLADLPDIPDDDDSSMSMHQGMSNHRNNNNNSSNSSHYNNNNNSSSSHYNNNNSHTTTTSTIHLAPPRPRRLWKVNDTALRPFPLYAPAPSSQCVRLIPHTPPSVVAIRIAECLRRRSVAVEYDDEAAVATCVTVDRCHFTLFLWAASDKHTLRLVSSSHHHTTRQQQQQRQQQQRQQQQRQRSSTSATTSTTAASASSFSLLPANSLLLTNDAIWVEGMRQRGSLVTFHRTLQAVFHAAASYATGAEDHDDDDIVVDDDNDDNDDHDVDSTLDNNNSSNNNNNPLPRPRLYRYHGPTGRRLFQSSPLEYPRLQAMSKTTTTTFNLGMEQHTTASIDGAAGAGGADHHHYRYNGSAATTYLHPAKQPKKTTNHDLATTNNTTTNNNNNNNHHPNTIMESSSFSSLFFSHADRTRLLPLPTMHASRVSAQAYQALEHIGHLLRKDRCEAQWLGMQQLVALTDPFASGVDTAMYAALAVLGAPIVMEYDDDNDDGDNNNNNNHHHHHGNKSNNNNNKPSSPPRDASLPREIHQQWIVRLLTDRLLPGEWPSLATTINQHTTTSSSQDVSGVAPPNTSFSFSCVQSLFGVGSHDRGDHPNNNHSLDVTTEPQPLDDDQDVTVGDEHHGGGLRSMALRALCNALTLLEDQQPHILKSVLQVQSPQLSQAPLIQALLDDVAGCSRPPAVIFGTRLASPHEAALAVRCLRILGAHSPTAKRRMLLPTSHHHIPVTVLLLDKARMVGQSTHQVLAHEANQAYHELTEDFRSC